MQRTEFNNINFRTQPYQAALTATGSRENALELLSFLRSKENYKTVLSIREEYII